MRTRLGKLSVAATAAILFGACADVPDPVSPIEADVYSRLENQGGLAQVFEHASPAVLALAGTVFADHDEANNRLLFGVENANAVFGVRTALARMGVPNDAFEVQVVEPIYQVASLRDQWRPTRGGIQIHFGQYLCTMGFNADDGTQRSFITNSHCTNRQGGVESTNYYQPLSSVNGTVIAVEVEDPQYFKGGACPRGRSCRYSDASRALYNASTASTRGAIAHTSGPNNGSLEVTGTFTVTTQNNTTTSFPIGTTVNKVGRTTGWTQGNVTNTCVNTNVSGTRFTQLCQTFVQGPGNAKLVGPGDSGSPVFIGTGNVQLVGILWGGSSDGRLFVFSPLKQIRDEIGPITATN